MQLDHCGDFTNSLMICTVGFRRTLISLIPMPKICLLVIGLDFRTAELELKSFVHDKVLAMCTGAGDLEQLLSWLYPEMGGTDISKVCQSGAVPESKLVWWLSHPYVRRKVCCRSRWFGMQNMWGFKQPIKGNRKKNASAWETIITNAL